tara:strand:- start:1577 stop:1783 length:207 start_codon:yes stop_codon:yes gene_type:complete
MKIKEVVTQTEHLIKLIIGIIILVAGIIGLFLPIIPGILLIILGLAILGISFHKIVKIVKNSNKVFKK